MPEIEQSIDDYIFGKSLGKGAYSEVVVAQSKISGHQSAMKIIDKEFFKKVYYDFHF